MYINEYVTKFSFDMELHKNISSSVKRITQAVVDDDIENLAIAYSGGKDSTALLILIAETVARSFNDRVKLHVVYSDTNLELPPLVEAAFANLGHFRKFCERHDINYVVHLTERPKEQSFWVLMIGKGYPPPNRYFRWCTDRLKIQPPRLALQKLPEKSGLFTGVRSDESSNRARTLKKGCSADGECGLERWTDAENQEGLRFYAPLIDWRTCKVWDYLYFNNTVSKEEWPIKNLAETYGTGATRFGCWTCTLVDEDKALQQVTSLQQWSHLKPMADFREILLKEAQLPENRLFRTTGAKGKLTLSFRKRLLGELLELQEKTGTAIISNQEIELIHQLWTDDLPDIYKSEASMQTEDMLF